MPADQLEKAAESGLVQAFSNYFDYRAKATERDMRELFRNGRRYLAIGLPVLIICLLASQIVHTLLGSNAIGRALEESLIIVGWVARLAAHRDISLRLAAAPSTIKPIPPSFRSQRNVTGDARIGEPTGPTFAAQLTVVKFVEGMLQQYSSNDMAGAAQWLTRQSSFT